MKCLNVFCFALTFLLCDFVFAQDTLPCIPKNVTEILFKKKRIEQKLVVTKRTSIILLPVFGSTPATGFFFGAGGLAAFQLGKSPITRMSSANLAAQYTTKNQMILMLKTNVYTPENKFFLQGDLRLLIYNQPTYGLGTNSSDTVTTNDNVLTVYAKALTNTITGAQPLSYNYLKVHQIISKTINENKSLFFLV